MTSPSLAVLAAVLAGAAAWVGLSGPGRHPAGHPAPRLASTSGGRSAPPPPALPAATAAVGHRPTRLRVAAVVAVGAAVWAFLPGSAGLAAAAVAMALTWRQSRAWEPTSVRRRRARLEAELPWVVDLLTAALRTGLGPSEALARVSAVCHPLVRRELAVPLARLRLGADPVAVWGALAGHPELGRLGVTLRRATESGAPVVHALDRLAEDLRSQRRAAVEIQVRRIEVKAAVPLGLCMLPAFVLLAVVPLVAGSLSSLLSR